MQSLIKFSKLIFVSFLFILSINQATAKTNWEGYTQKGKASYYADKYEGRKTASGELFKQNGKTAAHKKLPFGTKVKVTNIKNGKSVVVTINDRGPFSKGRIIDLTKSAFNTIGNTSAGVLETKIEVISLPKKKTKK